MADTLLARVIARTGLIGSDLRCPREKSDMTPCVARDGKLAVVLSHEPARAPDRIIPATVRPWRWTGARAICVGCEADVENLLTIEGEKMAGRQ